MWAVLTTEPSKEVSHGNLTCTKQSKPVFRVHELRSLSGFWGVPVQHRDCLTGCQLCFTLICPFPIILIWRQSKAPAYSSVSFLILHMFLKRRLHRNGYKWWQTTPYAVEMMLCVVAAIPSKMLCNLSLCQTKWYQPCPVGQFAGPAGILHIALSAFPRKPRPGRWSLPILTLVPPQLARLASSAQGWDMLSGAAAEHAHCKLRMGPMYLVAENNSIPGRNWPLDVRQKGTATL